jgi:hypothetical protein
MIGSESGSNMKAVSSRWVTTGKRLVALAVLLSLGCTVYTPLRGVDQSSGYDVRVTLSDQGALDLAPKIGPRGMQLEGTLKQMTDSSLLVAVRRVTRVGGGDDTYSGAEILLPSRDLEKVERSTTSVSRSLLAAGAVLASALLVAKGAGDVSGGKNAGPPPPGR